MAVNNFLPFGITSSMVLSQTAYAALTPANGRGAGIVPKEYFNKAIRQPSVMTSAIGELIKDNALDALDDGDLPTLKAHLLATLQAIAAAVVPAPSNIPVGALLEYGGAAAPAGFVLCDGGSYLRAGAMAALFAAIGTTFGAADGTHFNVPDMRGMIAKGVDAGRGLDPARALGTNQVGTLQGVAVDSLSGSVIGSASFHNAVAGSYATARSELGMDPIVLSGYGNTALVAGDFQLASVSLPQGTGVIGGDTIAVAAGVVRPNNVALNYIIKI